MEWTKVSIETTSDGADIIIAALTDEGISGFEIIDSTSRSAFFLEASQQWDYVDDSLLTNSSVKQEAYVVFYLGKDAESTDLLKRVKIVLGSLVNVSASPSLLGSLALCAETVNDQDWLHEWKKYFKPFAVGRVLIVPEWEAGKHDGDIVFTIDPGSAFGTGQHVTTMLCIQALQGYLNAGDKLLDIGCGSGILSIISLLLGAKNAVGCDIDPVAIEVARKNAALNPIANDALKLYAGDMLSDLGLQRRIGQGYDIVVANIVADVIKGIVPLVPTLLNPQGLFIASGIIDTRYDDVIETLVANQLTIVETTSSEGWYCVVARG